MKKTNVKALLTAIFIPVLVGFLSALISGNFGNKYDSFVKPPLSPPAILFPIVWTLLYAAMGAASYLIWSSARGTAFEKQSALRFYVAQLIVNFLWSIIFFRLEAYTLSVFVIILLDILVLITALKAKEINRLAFCLLIPYLIWLAFATYLNIGVAILN